MMSCATFKRISILLALAMGLGAGCSEKGRKPPKVKKVQGVATKIDLKNGVVAMSVLDEKGTARSLAGTIRDDTEVLINGRIQKLEDVREGDKVTVFGYRERSGDGEKLVATKVQVDRPAEKDWKTTPQASGAAPAPAKTEPAAPGKPPDAIKKS